MTTQQEIILNKWGQKLIQIEEIINVFTLFSLEEKRKYLTDLSHLILQSKPEINDKDEAIKTSNLKSTFTPCILLQKNGLKLFSFEVIIELPENELVKSLKLFLSLFLIAYNRRFEVEKNDINKWWYWDLSDEKNIHVILEKF